MTEVKERILKLNKHQKQFYSALKGSYILVLSCFKNVKGKLIYCRKDKEKKEIVGMGELMQDFNEQFVKANITKWFQEDKNIAGEINLDGKICIPISEEVYLGLMEARTVNESYDCDF